MDPVRNPFAPGAGTPPPELAGRTDVLKKMDVALQRVALGRPAQSSILVGLRGVGKTVLLVRVQSMADALAYRTLRVEAHEGKALVGLLLPGLRGALQALSLVEGAKEQARRGLRVLKSFMGSVKLKVQDVEIGLTIAPETGVADSGDLETDLPDLLEAVGVAARAAKQPFALLIDELQYLSSPEFSALIMSMHRLSQASLPVILIGAGLPQVLGLAGESKSYSERLFLFPDIGALPEQGAKDAVRKPVSEEGAFIEDGAISEILRVSERYAYFIQQWSHDAWNAAKENRITYDDVVRATPVAIQALDEAFFRVRFDRCTPAERRYMRALAEFGPGAARSGDIALKMGVRTQSVGPVRSSLIKKGMIYSPQHGDTAFTVPLFDSYMRRVMPTFD